MKSEEPAAGRTFSVGGGKGGVGKSVIAANLAISFAQAGAKTILVDADLGAANLHTLFNVQRVPKTLNDLFTHGIDHLTQAAVDVGVPQLQLIPGSSAVAGAANINHAQKLRLMRQIWSLEADAVVIDVGAGISFNVLDLFNLADFRLLVLTPQLTSIQNAYGFLKGATFRILQQLASQLGHAEAFESVGDTQRVPAILKAIGEKDARAGTTLNAVLESFGARLLGNNLFEESQRNTFHAVSRMVADFLGIALPVVGALRASRAVHDSVSQRRPYLLQAAGEENALALRRVADALLHEDPAPYRELRRQLRDPDELQEKRESGLLQVPPLPAPLQGYDRIHPRFQVHWGAELFVENRSLAIQVEDVSMSGARLSGAGALLPEQHCELRIPALSAERLSVVVRHADGRGFAGVEFLNAGSLPERLVAAAQAEGPH